MQSNSKTHIHTHSQKLHTQSTYIKYIHNVHTHKTPNDIKKLTQKVCTYKEDTHKVHPHTHTHTHELKLSRTKYTYKVHTHNAHTHIKYTHKHIHTHKVHKTHTHKVHKHTM